MTGFPQWSPWAAFYYHAPPRGVLIFVFSGALSTKLKSNGFLTRDFEVKSSPFSVQGQAGPLDQITPRSSRRRASLARPKPRRRPPRRPRRRARRPAPDRPPPPSPG